MIRNTPRPITRHISSGPLPCEHGFEVKHATVGDTYTRLVKYHPLPFLRPVHIVRQGLIDRHRRVAIPPFHSYAIFSKEQGQSLECRFQRLREEQRTFR